MKKRKRLRRLLLFCATHSLFAVSAYSQSYVSCIGLNKLDNEVQACSGFYKQDINSNNFGIHSSLLEKSDFNELNSQVNVIVYPNPSDGMVNIEFQNPGSSQISLYTIDGKELFSDKTNLSFMLIRLPLNKGNYFIYVTNELGSIKKLLQIN